MNAAFEIEFQLSASPFFESYSIHRHSSFILKFSMLPVSSKLIFILFYFWSGTALVNLFWCLRKKTPPLHFWSEDWWEGLKNQLFYLFPFFNPFQASQSGLFQVVHVGDADRHCTALLVGVRESLGKGLKSWERCEAPAAVCALVRLHWWLHP